MDPRTARRLQVGGQEVRGCLGALVWTSGPREAHCNGGGLGGSGGGSGASGQGPVGSEQGLGRSGGGLGGSGGRLVRSGPGVTQVDALHRRWMLDF